MMALFTIDKNIVTASPLDDLTPVLTVAASTRMIVAKRPDKLQAVLTAIDPDKEESHEFVTNGDWNLHDMFNAIIPFYAPAELWLATYSIFEYPLRQILLAQQEKQLISVQMVLEKRSKTQMEEAYQLAKNISNRIGLYALHAKAFVLRNANRCITVTGSQNWTNNPRLEIGAVSTSKRTAEFHINWMDKILNHADPFE